MDVAQGLAVHSLSTGGRLSRIRSSSACESGSHCREKSLPPGNETLGQNPARLLLSIDAGHRPCGGSGRGPIPLVSGSVVDLHRRLFFAAGRDGNRHLGRSREQVL